MALDLHGAIVHCPECDEMEDCDAQVISNFLAQGVPHRFQCKKCRAFVSVTFTRDRRAIPSRASSNLSSEIRDSGLRDRPHDQLKSHDDWERPGDSVHPPLKDGPKGGVEDQATTKSLGSSLESLRKAQEEIERARQQWEDAAKIADVQQRGLLQQAAKQLEENIKSVQQRIDKLSDDFRSFEDRCRAIIERTSDGLQSTKKSLAAAKQVADLAISAIEQQRQVLEAPRIEELGSVIENHLFSPGTFHRILESYYAWLSNQTGEKQRLRIVADLPELFGYVERELNSWRDMSVHDGVPEGERSQIVKILEGIDRRMVEWCAQHDIRRFPEPKSIFEPARHEKMGTEETDEPAYYDRIKEVQESGYVFSNEAVLGDREAVLGDRKAKVVVWIRRGMVGS